MEENCTYTAFAGERLIASGDVQTVLRRTKARIESGEGDPVLIFEDQTGIQLDFDLRGTPEEALARLAMHPRFASSARAETPRTGPGRPRLGVVCREVSLLPRHWSWLEQTSGGVSGALRRIVDEAMTRNRGQDRARLAREAASKFMWAMAGNLPHFEEASRSLFARDQARFAILIRDWPRDIRDHLRRLVDTAARLESDVAAEGSPPASKS